MAAQSRPRCKRASAGEPHRRRSYSNLLGATLRNKKPLLSRLNQAYVGLLAIPEGADGSRTVSLARYGAYEVRLVEFPHRHTADACPFWIRLYRRDLRSAIDTRRCDDLDDAEIAAAHLVARARELHRSAACGAAEAATATSVA
jgi:hypothetical protein